MDAQLTIDGREVAMAMVPKFRRLTTRQRDLLLYVRMVGLVTTDEARHFYADPTGALVRLEALGLVQRAGRGLWEPRP